MGSDRIGPFVHYAYNYVRIWLVRRARLRAPWTMWWKNVSYPQSAEFPQISSGGGLEAHYVFWRCNFAVLPIPCFAGTSSRPTTDISFNWELLFSEFRVFRDQILRFAQEHRGRIGWIGVRGFRVKQAIKSQPTRYSRGLVAAWLIVNEEYAFLIPTFPVILSFFCKEFNNRRPDPSLRSGWQRDSQRVVGVSNWGSFRPTTSTYLI